MVPFVVAIEGIVHAGKSTLHKRLSEKHEEITCIGEYVEYATEKFPAPPRSLEEARVARLYFLNLELLRVNSTYERGRIILLDRSILSILAYHFAIERLTGLLCYKASLLRFCDEDWMFPDSCLYLDISDETLYSRHKAEKGNYQRILLNKAFNGYLRRFYEEVAPVEFPYLAVRRIDASQSQENVESEALEVIRSMLK